MRIQYPKVAPELYNAMGNVAKQVAASSIPTRLRALVEMRVSQINGCAYCLDMHAHEAREAGEKQQRLDCLPAWRETDFFDARERAALAWAEAVTELHPGHVPDDVFNAVREQFSEKEVVELTFIVAVMNTWNRLAISMRSGPRARE